MKYKVIALAAIATFIYSCASKSSVPTTEVKKEEIKKEVVRVAELPADLAEGKNLYENNCAKCHKLYDAKDFSAEEWKPIVTRMQRKAHLDDAQGQKIYNYITMK